MPHERYPDVSSGMPIKPIQKGIYFAIGLQVASIAVLFYSLYRFKLASKQEYHVKLD